MFSLSFCFAVTSCLIFRDYFLLFFNIDCKICLDISISLASFVTFVAFPSLQFQTFSKEEDFSFCSTFFSLLTVSNFMYNTKILVNGYVADLTADLMLVQMPLEVFRWVFVGLLCVVLLQCADY